MSNDPVWEKQVALRDKFVDDFHELVRKTLTEFPKGCVRDELRGMLQDACSCYHPRIGVE